MQIINAHSIDASDSYLVQQSSHRISGSTHHHTATCTYTIVSPSFSSITCNFIYVYAYITLSNIKRGS